MPKRAKQWPPIYKAKQRSGQVYFQVDLGIVDGKRKRPYFPTRAAAETYAEQARVARENEGTAAFSLGMDIRLDASKAHQIVAPHNVTILEATKYYQKHVLAYKDAPNIKAIVADYIKDAESRNLRPATIKDLKSRLNAFADDFGESKLSEMALDDLKDWLNDYDDPRTRINYRTKLSQLYIYAIGKNWADSNLTEKLATPKVDDSTPEIFTVEEAKRLLTHAKEFGLLPYIAIGLFAGVRFAEMTRLDGKDIKFNDKVIRIGPEVAKKRSQRNIDMHDALLCWLEPCRKQLEAGGFVVTYDKTFRNNKDLLQEAAEIKEWKANGLRHSFGSYHLAHFKDIADTAHQMGNSADMVNRFYKALVTPADAALFWDLRPKQ